MESEKTITLRKPVSLGSVIYDHLDLREPEAGELETANKAGTGISVAIKLLSIICKVPEAAIRKLSQRDLEEACDFLGGFSSAKDSETSSLN